MELKVASTLFNSNSGGGGTFYMGRGDKDERRKQQEEDEETGELANDELAFSSRDAAALPPRHRSHLALGLPLPAPLPVDAEALAAELNQELANKMLLLNVAVTRMERAMARRLRAEVGEMLIGA